MKTSAYPTITQNGHEFDFEAALMLMDDEIYEELHSSITRTISDQEFFDMYCEAHREKFGDEFVIN